MCFPSFAHKTSSNWDRTTWESQRKIKDELLSPSTSRIFPFNFSPLLASFLANGQSLDSYGLGLDSGVLWHYHPSSSQRAIACLHLDDRDKPFPWPGAMSEWAGQLYKRPHIWVKSPEGHRRPNPAAIPSVLAPWLFLRRGVVYSRRKIGSNPSFTNDVAV